MNIVYRDDNARLDDEIRELMQSAAEQALENEFGAALEEIDLRIEDLPVDLSVSVVGYDEIQELNRDFRGIDRVTDVLSFPQFADRNQLLEMFGEYETVDDEEAEDSEEMSEDECFEDECFEDEEWDPGVVLGDVVICYDRAVEQAEEYGTGIRRELVYLFVHSVFHLLGYDHMEEDERAEMRRREEQVLTAIQVTR